MTAKKANFTEVEALFDTISQVNIVKDASKFEHKPKQGGKKKKEQVQ